MRKIFIIIIVAGILFSCGFQKNKRNDGDKPVVTVSILPLKTFVEKIAGNDFKVNVLLPPGASPADFTLVPSQIKDITHSEVWFRIGHIGFEYSWKDKIQQVNMNMKVVDLSDGLDLIRDETLPSGYKSTTAGVNPHTWMSPELVKQMASQITEELSMLNPDKKVTYNENYRQFVKEIEELHNQIANDLKDYKGRQFIMFHPSLSYYARDYGLVQYSLEPGGKEPTPQRMAEVVDLARREGIRVIYIQSDLDQDQARVFAEEIDGKIIQMWPLNPEWIDNLEEITGMLIDNF
jgi:zinc transport system substrate-binding protein